MCNAFKNSHNGTKTLYFLLKIQIHQMQTQLFAFDGCKYYSHAARHLSVKVQKVFEIPIYC